MLPASKSLSCRCLRRIERTGRVFLFYYCTGYCAGLPSAIEIGVIDFNWSSSLSTLFQSS